MNLNRGSISDFGSGLRDRIGNAYEQLARTDDYKRNDNHLRIIQAAVVAISAVATGFTNAFAHRDRIGDIAAFGLALLIVVFVERFYFVLRDGLTRVYQSGKQRFYAMICYRIIQVSMILNATILAAWITGFTVPPWLDWWNHWSIVVHFSLALIGVQAVRDSDAVVENRMLELKAATARQDIVTLRKSAALGNPLPLVAARLRGIFDAIALSFRLLFSSGGFSKKFMAQINEVAREQYGHIDAMPSAAPPAFAQRRPGVGFVNQSQENAPPKSQRPWI